MYIASILPLQPQVLQYQRTLCTILTDMTFLRSENRYISLNSPVILHTIWLHSQPSYRPASPVDKFEIIETVFQLYSSGKGVVIQASSTQSASRSPAFQLGRQCFQ